MTIASQILSRIVDEEKLTAASREEIDTRDFALPGRRYPIHNISHARNALARVSQHGSPAEKKRVRNAVRRRYPEIEQND